MTDLHPIPDAEGIAKTKDMYLNRFGKTLTDEQAAEVLGRVMRFLFFVAELAASGDGAPTPKLCIADIAPATATPAPPPVASKS